jgi:hypothetical protein
MQPEFSVDRLELRWLDQLAMRHARGMQGSIQHLSSCRISRDGRLTLVIDETLGQHCITCWPRVRSTNLMRRSRQDPYLHPFLPRESHRACLSVPDKGKRLSSPPSTRLSLDRLARRPRHVAPTSFRVVPKKIGAPPMKAFYRRLSHCAAGWLIKPMTPRNALSPSGFCPVSVVAGVMGHTCPHCLFPTNPHRRGLPDEPASARSFLDGGKKTRPHRWALFAQRAGKGYKPPLCGRGTQRPSPCLATRKQNHSVGQTDRVVFPETSLRNRARFLFW